MRLNLAEWQRQLWGESHFEEKNYDGCLFKTHLKGFPQSSKGYEFLVTQNTSLDRF